MKKPIKIAAAIYVGYFTCCCCYRRRLFFTCYRLPHKLEVVNIQTADTKCISNGNDADGTSDNLSETVQNQVSSVNGKLIRIA